MKKILLVALFLAGCSCIGGEDYRLQVESRRAFFEAVRPDLSRLYGSLEEPSRSTRLATLEQEEAVIRAQERRAGIAPVATTIR